MKAVFQNLFPSTKQHTAALWHAVRTLAIFGFGIVEFEGKYHRRLDKAAAFSEERRPIFDRFNRVFVSHLLDFADDFRHFNKETLLDYLLSNGHFVKEYDDDVAYYIYRFVGRCRSLAASVGMITAVCSKIGEISFSRLTAELASGCCSYSPERILDDVYKNFGFEWDGYFQYINKSNPLFLSGLQWFTKKFDFPEVNMTTAPGEFGESLLFSHEMADLREKTDFGKLNTIVTCKYGPSTNRLCGILQSESAGLIREIQKKRKSKMVNGQSIKVPYASLAEVTRKQEQSEIPVPMINDDAIWTMERISRGLPLSIHRGVYVNDWDTTPVSKFEELNDTQLSFAKEELLRLEKFTAEELQSVKDKWDLINLVDSNRPKLSNLKIFKWVYGVDGEPIPSFGARCKEGNKIVLKRKIPSIKWLFTKVVQDGMVMHNINVFRFVLWHMKLDSKGGRMSHTHIIDEQLTRLKKFASEQTDVFTVTLYEKMTVKVEKQDLTEIEFDLRHVSSDQFKREEKRDLRGVKK